MFKKIETNQKKGKKQNKIFDANHAKQKPNFVNLALKKPIKQPCMGIICCIRCASSKFNKSVKVSSFILNAVKCK